MLKNKFIYLIIVSMIFSFYSCQTILKAYTGIRDPQLTLSTNERLEYYNPFIEKSDSNFELRLVKEMDTLINAFNKFQSYPLIFIQDRTVENDIYMLNCFEDMSYDIENINTGNFEELTKGKISEISDLKVYLEVNSEITYSNFIDKNNKWNIYVISGTFLGNKLKKRMLPIMELKNLNKVIILDLSIEKDE